MLILGRMLILAGGVAAGVALLLRERLGLPTRLPGDLVWRRGPVTFSFPLVSSLVLSLLLTVLLNLLLRRR